MMDIDAIGRSLAAVSAPTETILLEFDQKATAARVLGKPDAVVLAPADVRALTATVRSMLAVNRDLFRSLKHHHELVDILTNQVAAADIRRREQDALLSRSLGLFASLQNMGFWELRKFQNKLRSGGS